MGYIGATPSNAFINNDVQRVTNSTNNYVDLDHNISSLDSVIVFVNNVRQESTNLTFTSASRITLGDTLTSSDVVEIVFIGKAVSTQSPGTGTVSNDMLAGSIANSKLATDPLNASNLASGTVPTARLGSGTASSSTVLFGDQTFKTAPSGDLVHINTTSGTSNVTSFNINDIFTSSYKVYRVICCFIADTDNMQISCRYNKSSGSTVGSDSSYKYIASGRKVASGNSIENSFNAHSANSTFELFYNADTDTTYSPLWADLIFFDPLQSFVSYQHFQGSLSWFTNDSKLVVNQISGQYRENFNATGLTFLREGSGNISRYFVNTYGLANSGN